MKNLITIAVLIGIVTSTIVMAQPNPDQTWGLCIGIAEYIPDDLSLRWADNDAMDFGNFLKRDLHLPETHYRILANSEATRENILKHLYWLNTVTKPGDRVYIFYSGHGKPSSPFLPYDSQNLLPGEDIKKFLKSNKAQEIIVFADIGYQGRLRNQEAQTIAEYEGLTGWSKEVMLGMSDARDGLIFITPDSTVQQAEENTGQKNSLFTHYLLNTVMNRQQEADINNDRKLTLYEVYQDIIQHVLLTSPSPQAEQIVLLDFPSSLSPAKKGITSTTKFAIGAGILATGGLTFAVIDRDDNDNNISFTGIFKREITGVAERDGIRAETYWTFIMELDQDGTLISGRRKATAVHPLCCTASLTVPIAGSVNGTSATISWPEESAQCSSTESCSYSIRVLGGTYKFTLEDNGRILRREDGKDYIRQ